MAKKKENSQEPAKGFIMIGFKSIVSGDMDFLRDDLDEDPDNPYLNWVMEKTTERNTLTVECPIKLVNELLEKNMPCNYISRWELEKFGKNVGEEAFVEPLIAKCDDIAVESNARAVQQDWALARSWRDDGFDLEGEERIRWKELLLKNINNGLAKNFFTLEDFKKDLEDCPDEEKPKDESGWENEYSKYIDCRVDDYYEEVDDYKDKKKHMKGSGLKTWDEKNVWSLEKCRDWLLNLGDDSNYEWYVDSFWLEDEKGNKIKEQTQN